MSPAKLSVERRLEDGKNGLEACGFLMARPNQDVGRVFGLEQNAAFERDAHTGANPVAWLKPPLAVLYHLVSENEERKLVGRVDTGDLIGGEVNSQNRPLLHYAVGLPREAAGHGLSGFSGAQGITLKPSGAVKKVGDVLAIQFLPPC